jgi:phage gpG-like protein
MSFDTSVEFKDEDIKKFLNDLEENVKKVETANLPRLIAIFSTIVFKDVQKHFQDSSGEDGKWAPWSKNYKRKNGQILRDTGRLRNTFKPAMVRRESDGILWYNNATTKKGFPYAYAHDNGEAPRTILPRRSFMWLSRSAFEEIAKATLEVLIGT